MKEDCTPPTNPPILFLFYSCIRIEENGTWHGGSGRGLRGVYCYSLLLLERTTPPTAVGFPSLCHTTKSFRPFQPPTESSCHSMRPGTDYCPCQVDAVFVHVAMDLCFNMSFAFKFGRTSSILRACVHRGFLASTEYSVHSTAVGFQNACKIECSFFLFLSKHRHFRGHLPRHRRVQCLAMNRERKNIASRGLTLCNGSLLLLQTYGMYLRDRPPGFSGEYCYCYL